VSQLLVSTHKDKGDSTDFINYTKYSESTGYKTIPKQGATET